VFGFVARAPKNICLIVFFAVRAFSDLGRYIALSFDAIPEVPPQDINFSSLLFFCVSPGLSYYLFYEYLLRLLGSLQLVLLIDNHSGSFFLPFCDCRTRVS